MKYRFLKLSILSFTTYFLAVPVNADLVELNPNSNNVSEDRIEQLTNTLAQGSYADLLLKEGINPLDSHYLTVNHNVYIFSHQIESTPADFIQCLTIFFFEFCVSQD